MYQYLKAIVCSSQVNTIGIWRIPVPASIPVSPTLICLASTPPKSGKIIDPQYFSGQLRPWK